MENQKKKVSVVKERIQKNQRAVGNHGFSLLELMAVMVILGLIATIAVPQYFKQVVKAKQHTAKTQIEMLMTAMDSYRLDVGKYPSGQEGIEALVENSGSDKWAGPYLQKGVPNDPWDNPYIYENPGQNGEIDIYSYGADGQSGGDGENADVGSWQ